MEFNSRLIRFKKNKHWEENKEDTSIFWSRSRIDSDEKKNSNANKIAKIYNEARYMDELQKIILFSVDEINLISSSLNLQKRKKKKYQSPAFAQQKSRLEQEPHKMDKQKER